MTRRKGKYNPESEEERGGRSQGKVFLPDPCRKRESWGLVRWKILWKIWSLTMMQNTVTSKTMERKDQRNEPDIMRGRRMKSQ